MSKLARDNRNGDLARIHQAKAALGMSEADYRTMLRAQGGKDSARDLDHTGRQRVIAHLERCGWKKPKKTYSQADKIAYFWRRLGEVGALRDPSPQALLEFVGRTAGTGVSHLKFLPVTDAAKVIEALKSWLARAEKAKTA